MTDIFKDQTEDAVVDGLDLAGVTFFTVTGELRSGVLEVSLAINGGYATLFTYTGGSDDRCYKLTIPAGTQVKAEIFGSTVGTNLTLSYIHDVLGCFLVDDLDNKLIDDEGLFLVTHCP